MANKIIAASVSTVSYYAGLALLFTHEMDAVLRSEWRLLYILRDLDDSLAATVFIALHVPLFLAFFWLGHHPNSRLQSNFRLLVATFLVIHAGLHLKLSGVAVYEFHSVLSASLIYGAGLFGVIYLLVAMAQGRRLD